MERVPPVESNIGGTGWTEGGEGSPERRARAGDRIEHNTTTGGLESGREKCGPVELRGVRRFYFPCLRLMTSPDSSTASLRCVSPVPARPSFGAGYLRVPRNLAPGIRRFYFPLAEEVPSIFFLFRLQERGKDGRKSKGREEGRKEGRKEGNWTSSIPNGRCHFGVRALLFPTHATPFPPTCSSCRPGPVLLHSHGEAYDARDGCSG